MKRIIYLITVLLIAFLGCTEKAENFYDSGNSKLSHGDFEEAIIDYTKAIELDPDYALAYCMRGVVKSYLKQYESAVTDCDKAVELNPNSSTVYFNRAYVMSALGAYDKAIADLDRAIELDPHDGMAYSNRGGAKVDYKDYTGAMADYDMAIKLKPEFSMAYNNRGNLKYKLDDYEGAVVDYNKAINLDPELARAYYARGVAYYALDNVDNSCEDFYKARELGWEYADMAITEICQDDTENESIRKTKQLPVKFGMSIVDAEKLLGVKSHPHPLTDPPTAIMIISTSDYNLHFNRVVGLEKICYKQENDNNSYTISPFTISQYNPPASSQIKIKCGINLDLFVIILNQWKKELESEGYEKVNKSRNVGIEKYNAKFNDNKARRWYQVEIGAPRNVGLIPSSGALWFFEFNAEGILKQICAVDLIRSHSYVELRQAAEMAIEKGIQLEPRSINLQQQ